MATYQSIQDFITYFNKKIQNNQIRTKTDEIQDIIKKDDIIKIIKIFEYSTPDTVNVVFIFDGAKDPYSAMHEKILTNLIKYKHITSKNIIDQHNNVMCKTTYYKLESIMYQGVLFIDTSESIYPGWGDIIKEFITYLSEYKINKLQPCDFIILKDNLPDEDIFKHINNKLIDSHKLPIKWDMQQTILAFTDGGCVGNGTPNAIASYATYIMTGHNNQIEVSGIIESFEYAMISDDILMGFKITNKSAVPTNNRGEYFAWCWILLILLRTHTYCAVEIVSDCNLFIKTLTEWLPNRKLKKTESELKNYDLVYIADILLSELQIRTGNRVKLTHINSHKEAPPKTNKLEYVKWLGNSLVDSRASELLKSYKQTPMMPKGPFIQFKKPNGSIIEYTQSNIEYTISKFE
jgi:ribonuclease HI